MHTFFQAEAGDRRTRSGHYLAASLYCDGFPSAVKIRNLSPTGALVEGSRAFTTGTLVQLVRGSLIVHALVAWVENGRCGLNFSGKIDVEQWRATPRNAEQERIDDVVRLVTAGAVPLPLNALPADIPESVEALSADLQRAWDLLETLGNRLSKDSIVVAVYPSELQSLDIAMQVIAAVRGILDGESDLAIDAVKFISLRKSADEALRSAVG